MRLSLGVSNVSFGLGKESRAILNSVFLDEARKVAKDYPQIQTDDANIDAIGMWLLKNPFNYDVLVACWRSMSI